MPRFIQIMATGAGEGYSTHLYALGDDGNVYKWTSDRVRNPDTTSRSLYLTHRFWQKLEEHTEQEIT